ncbi:hypothetical protein DFH07DRAFT_805243 [Mycena maculata]|uniref:SET domain-containing protein n=1 Tax=Mycena maculata TaxID=230809 RepID=A0AAD7JSL9_9AGAR|nr:hypothetical protein DFH07DRAFT_805243 [Mycena maculata]
MPPNQWPSNVQYISTCSYHFSVPKDMRAFLADGATSVEKTNSQSLVVIRRISSPTHPAKGQFGLFSTSKIPTKTHIVDYIGEIHCDEREDSDYDLSLYRDGDLSVGIDASRMGNEGRFVNDYRGVQDKPNAICVDARTRSGLTMRIESCRTIKKGEEILVSYGKAWWQARRLAE